MVMGKDQIAGVPITIVVLDDESLRICSDVRVCMTKSRHVCKTLQPSRPTQSLMQLNHERCFPATAVRLKISCRRIQPEKAFNAAI
jgi:hypothetical protein